MDKLKEALMKQAREKGICVDGYSEMRTDNMDMLVDYYIQNPDWCLERNFPTLDCLKVNFNNIGNKGVFVCKTFRGELLNDLQAYIFHNCRGTIKVSLNVEKQIIPMLYLANKCKLVIQGVGDFIPHDKDSRTKVPVYIFGKNDVSARDNKYVEFTKYKQELI